MKKKFLFLSLSMIFLVGCGNIQVDNVAISDLKYTDLSQTEVIAEVPEPTEMITEPTNYIAVPNIKLIIDTKTINCMNTTYSELKSFLNWNEIDDTFITKLNDETVEDEDTHITISDDTVTEIYLGVHRSHPEWLSLLTRPLSEYCSLNIGDCSESSTIEDLVYILGDYNTKDEYVTTTVYTWICVDDSILKISFSNETAKMVGLIYQK